MTSLIYDSCCSFNMAAIVNEEVVVQSGNQASNKTTSNDHLSSYAENSIPHTFDFMPCILMQKRRKLHIALDNADKNLPKWQTLIFFSLCKIETLFQRYSSSKTGNYAIICSLSCHSGHIFLNFMKHKRCLAEWPCWSFPYYKSGKWSILSKLCNNE